jgi:hypothetical protein
LPCFQISEADILQVATVMGFDDELDVTDDIGAADVILASSSEMKQHPWIHNVAKYHKLPIFVVKVITWSTQFVLSTLIVLVLTDFCFLLYMAV